MMDTVLNLGLNDDVAAGLARETGDARFAYDSYRRFVRCTATSSSASSPRTRKTDPFEAHPRGEEGGPRRRSSTPS